MRRRAFILLGVGAWAAWLGAPSEARERSLSLTSVERAAIWRSLGNDAMKAQEPAGLQVGDVIPGTMQVLRFDRRLRRRAPALRRYSYTLVHGQVLIVDPRSNKIVFVVAQ
jgi:hypothetical protein